MSNENNYKRELIDLLKKISLKLDRILEKLGKNLYRDDTTFNKIDKTENDVVFIKKDTNKIDNNNESLPPYKKRKLNNFY